MTAADSTTKQCSKCKCIKQTSDFYKKSSTRDGMQSRCIVCEKHAAAKYRADNPEKIKSANSKWYANNPEKSKAIHAKWYADNREKAKAASNQWYVTNKDKAKAYNAKWYTDNADKRIAKGAKWRASNPDKVKMSSAKWYVNNTAKANATNTKWRINNPKSVRIHYQNRRAKEKMIGGKLSVGLSDRLMKLQRGKCACCGLPLGEKYHLDHIMPLALGGSNTDDNIQLLRSQCNHQKHAKHPVDFMQQRGYLL